MRKFSATLLSEIEQALDAITFGSVEIYVQDKQVTQITVRNIKKTSVSLKTEQGETKQISITNSSKLEDTTLHKQRAAGN